MLAIWKNDNSRSPGTGSGVSGSGRVMKAASWRNLVLSPSVLLASKWWPQCSEFVPWYDRFPPGGVTWPGMLAQVPAPVAGQWMCQSMSLSGSMRQPMSCGGTWKPPQPTADRTLMPPGWVETVTPIVSLWKPGVPRSCGLRSVPGDEEASKSFSKVSGSQPACAGMPSGGSILGGIPPLGASISSTVSIFVTLLTVVPNDSLLMIVRLNSPCCGLVG